MSYVDEIMDKVVRENPAQPEFHQAVQEVLESLRVVIGGGQGHNWWCVAFPTLCMGATTDEFEAAAQTAGMDDTLSETLSGGCQMRFYLLDALGRVENLWFREK